MNNPNMTVLQELARRLETRVPGLTVAVFERPELFTTPIALDGRYACPCGEISRIQYLFNQELILLDPGFSENYEHHFLTRLRDHVRSEGHEPTF